MTTKLYNNINNTIIAYCGSLGSSKGTKSDTLEANKELHKFLSALFDSSRDLVPTTTLVAFPIRLDPHLIPGQERDLDNRKYWVPHDVAGSTLTNPKEFNPNSFQFIVHVIGPSAYNYRETLKNPEIVFKTRLLSCSLINQVTHKTFILDCGLILKIPPQNIYATASFDMELRNKAVDKDNAEAHLLKKNKHEHLDTELSRVNRNFGIRSPEDILARTHPTKINEVAVLGKTAYGEIEVIGIFRKVLRTEKGTSYPGTDKRIYPLLDALAQTRGLPEVAIPISYVRGKQKKTMTKAKEKLPGKEESPMPVGKEKHQGKKKFQDKEEIPMRTGKQKRQEKNKFHKKEMVRKK